MRKVKYIPASNMIYNKLTPHKIYEANDISEYVVDLIDDMGYSDVFYIYLNNSRKSNNKEFYDITTEYRNNIIDEILS